MDDKAVYDLLKSLQVDTRNSSVTGSASGTKWLNVSCPFAPFTHAKGRDKNPSFGITLPDSGRSHYKCLSCGLKGRLSSLPTRLGAYRNKDYGKLRHWAEMSELQASIHRPVTDWEDESAGPSNEREHRETIPPVSALHRYPLAVGSRYLRRRGIVWPTPLKLGLRYDAYQHRVLFPCYDTQKRFRGFTGRSTLPSKRISKKNPKVRDYFGLNKRKLFLGLRDRGKGPRIISEGLFDFAMSVHYGYTNARAILGTSLTDEKIDILISEGEPVYFFMDNDLAGWQALFGVFNENGDLEKDNAWAWRLYTEIPVWIVPYPGVFDGSDPSSISSSLYKKCIDKAWLFTGIVPMDENNTPNLMPLRT